MCIANQLPKHMSLRSYSHFRSMNHLLLNSSASSQKHIDHRHADHNQQTIPNWIILNKAVLPGGKTAMILLWEFHNFKANDLFKQQIFFSVFELTHIISLIENIRKLPVPTILLHHSINLLISSWGNWYSRSVVYQLLIDDSFYFISINNFIHYYQINLLTGNSICQHHQL